jgi:hypothetical protein
MLRRPHAVQPLGEPIDAVGEPIEARVEILVGRGCVPLLVDFRRSLRADGLNSIFDQPITIPPAFLA